jgi:mRNA-degrading endonuclease toxin of MazEF toxin-antitoxin module
VASPQALQVGRIVWAEVADQNGFRKQRPAIVVSVTEERNELTVVAVTSRVPDVLPDDHVLLPWHSQGHPRTGLNRKSAAVCSWIAEIAASDILDVAGRFPDQNCWRS